MIPTLILILQVILRKHPPFLDLFLRLYRTDEVRAIRESTQIKGLQDYELFFVLILFKEPTFLSVY